MNAPASQPESTALAVVSQQFDLSPRNFEEAWRMAEYLSDSDMVPKDFKGKPANCLVAVQWGAELGLKTMQAIQNIAVINGRPSLWGDVMLALVRSSPLCEYVVEDIGATSATCKVKRRGEPEQSRTFTEEDAKTAGLLSKDGPWKNYRKRMLQMRARAWALRDVFTDVLKGLHMAEEAMDMPPPEKFMGPAEIVPPAVPECWPDDLFAQRLPEWHKAIAAKKATADAIIAKAQTKHPLTDAQKAAIREVPAAAPAAEKTTDKVTDAGPVVSYAQVADAIAKAQDIDKLAEAEDLIGAVADPKQRAELVELAKTRREELQPE